MQGRRVPIACIGDHCALIDLADGAQALHHRNQLFPVGWSVASLPPPQSLAGSDRRRSGHCSLAQSISGRCLSSPANPDRRNYIVVMAVPLSVLPDSVSFFFFASCRRCSGVCSVTSCLRGRPRLRLLGSRPRPPVVAGLPVPVPLWPLEYGAAGFGRGPVLLAVNRHPGLFQNVHLPARPCVEPRPEPLYGRLPMLLLFA